MRDALWIVTLIFAMLTAGLRPQDSRLPAGDVIRLEFAFTEARAGDITAGWNVPGFAGARAIQDRDKWWPWLYGGLLVCLCLLAGGPGAGTYAVLSIVAVLLDLIENIGMNKMVDGDFSFPWPLIAGIFATAKFALIGIVLLRIVARLKRGVV